MKCRFLSAALLLVSLGLTSCSNTSTTTGTSGLGYVWVVAQGNTSVTFYPMNLTTGELTVDNNSAALTGHLPSAVIVAPSGKAMFIANTNDNNISSYTINSDGTLTVAGSATATKQQTPVSLAIDPGGKFLYVANQGDSTISIFSISGTTLSLLTSVTTVDLSNPSQTQTAPSALAITGSLTGSGNYLYVANQLTNTVSTFQYDSTSGALTQLSPFSVLAGTNPTGLVLSPDQNFLYVANSGSNNISSFSTCAVVSSNCGTTTGMLSSVSGSPFPAGTNPVSLAMTPAGEFLYAANKGSNEITGYKAGSGTGVLTPTATASFSTGLNPTWVAIPPEGKFVYVANSGGSSVTAYGINTTNGFLGEVTGSPYSISNTPTAIAIR